MKWTVAVDFDGVIHQYTSPWVARHVIPDGPVEGAIEWLHFILQKFDVVIYSTRCSSWRGRRAVRRWLRKEAQGLWNEAPGFRGLEDLKLSDRKPAALIYLDDRAVRFQGPGSFPSIQAIHDARPWNKGGATAPVVKRKDSRLVAHVPAGECLTRGPHRVDECGRKDPLREGNDYEVSRS